MDALHRFHRSLKTKQDLSTGAVQFRALIRYFIGGRTHSLKSEVYIDLAGRDAGKITLEGSSVDPETFRTEFTPQWEKYKLDPDDSLRISGESADHGKFEIRITAD
jgi:hypothetical protein